MEKSDKHLSKMVPRKASYRRQCLILSALIVASIVLIYCIHTIMTNPQFNYYETVSRYKSIPISNRTKIILLWTSFFGSRNWYLPGDTVNQTYFEKSKCPATNCILTTDRHYLPSVDLFDAVFFHGAEAFPILKPTPDARQPEQVYIFFIQESPAHTKHDLSQEQNFYNITMTYRLDSDIVVPYGHLRDIASGAIVAPTNTPRWRQPSDSDSSLTDDIRLKIANKQKMAAWFVSHCASISRRDDLVKKLSEYIEVDVYGRCGTLSCPRSSDKCNQLLDNEYKFYFSFENSLCVDYVTEKFYHALERFIIPVVYGGANYDLFAPPHSYINANDYETAEDLAKYLKYLNDNPKEYIKYFWWKKYYKVVYKSLYCDLCTRLNNPAAREKTQYYKEIKEWWYGNACYDKPKIKFD